MSERLDALQQRIPLGPGWEAPDLFEERAEVPGAAARIVGLHARHGDGLEVTASAAGDGSDVLHRAYFELLERIAIVERAEAAGPLPIRSCDGRLEGHVPKDEVFPPPARAGQRHALSNGVAAHVERAAAGRSAWLELIERDRVLRSWYFGVPRLRPLPVGDSCLETLPSHRSLACEVPAGADPARDVAVVALFLFPRIEGAPFACSFAAGNTPAEARLRAEREGLQRLGFLWGEPLPATPPSPSPSPEYHLDHYLHPGSQAAIERWIAGEAASPTRVAPEPRAERIRFADLTPAWLEGRAVVVRCLSPARMPLVFGEGHPWLGDGAEAPVHPVA